MNKETLSNKKIEEISFDSKNECSCNTCNKMCQTAPCIGTPSDIRNLVAAGYSPILRKSTWAAGLVEIGMKTVEMVQIGMNDDGSCPLHINNKCLLHHTGLKPLEGKLAKHEDPLDDSDFSDKEKLMIYLTSSPYLVALSWLSDENNLIIEDLNKIFK